MPITAKEWERFYALRTRLFELIQAVDEGYHKSYEGAMEITVRFDNIYAAEHGADSPPFDFLLSVHCYLLIDGRHKDFEGETFAECLDQFEYALVDWEKEWEDELSEYRERKKQP